MHKCVSRKKPFLKPDHVVKRLRWADDNSDRAWRTVIFTDEASVEMGKKGGGYHGQSGNQESNSNSNTSLQHSNRVARAS